MLKHVSFVTLDPDGIVAFYALLGGQLTKDVTTPDGLRRLVLTFDGGGKLQFFHDASAPQDPTAVTVGGTPGSWMEHVAFELPDLRGAVSALRAAGVRFTRDLSVTPSGNPVAFALDPDARHVELLQR